MKLIVIICAYILIIIYPYLHLSIAHMELARMFHYKDHFYNVQQEFYLHVYTTVSRAIKYVMNHPLPILNQKRKFVGIFMYEYNKI